MALVNHSTAIQEMNSYLSLIRSSLLGGWAMWEELPDRHRMAMNPSARAAAVHSFIIDCASRMLLEADVFDLSTLKLFVLKNKYSLRFKKFDGYLISKNQPTSQVESYRKQEQLPGVPSLHNLEAGYVLDELGQKVLSTHIVCPNGKSNYWAMELKEDGVSEIFVDMFDNVENDSNSEQPAKFRRKKSGIIVPFESKDDHSA